MRRGEIWLAKADALKGLSDPTTVVIVGNEALNLLPLRLVVPLVERKAAHERAAWMAPVMIASAVESGSVMPTAAKPVAYSADALRVGSIPVDHLIRPLGALTDGELEGLMQALRIVLRIE